MRIIYSFYEGFCFFFHISWRRRNGRVHFASKNFNYHKALSLLCGVSGAGDSACAKILFGQQRNQRPENTLSYALRNSDTEMKEAMRDRWGVLSVLRSHSTWITHRLSLPYLPIFIQYIRRYIQPATNVCFMPLSLPLALVKYK